MFDKYLTYLNTGLIALFVLFSVFSGHGGHLLGASNCTGSITCLYDINVDSTNGIGTATYQVNGLTAVASSGAGIAFTGTTYTATTSITDAGTLSVTGATTFSGKITAVGGSACATSSYQVPVLSPTFSTVGAHYASTSVTLTNVAKGDLVIVGFTPTSNTTGTLDQQSITEFGASASGSAIVSFSNLGVATTTAINTSTITVCYIH